MIAGLNLQAAAEIYNAVPARSGANEQDSNIIVATKKLVADVEAIARSRRTSSIQQRARIATFLEDNSLEPKSIETLLDELSTIIPIISAQIADQRAYVEYVEKDSEKILANVKNSSPEIYKPAKKMFGRFIEIGQEMHSDALDLYYFLLSLKAEYDPEATGGNSFSDPDELAAFLQSELAS